MAADQMHEPSPACIPARLAGTVRSPLAVQLERDVLAALGGHGWVRYPDLLALAPEGRVTVIPELESEQPFGYDDPRGASYDAGPSGRPDGGMLADVLTHLRDELLTGEGYPPDGAGRSVRLYDPEERVGLGEIAERLRVKRDTVDHWRVRGVLPETGLTEGRRPRWPWRAIRDWAFATGRDAGARRAMWLLALPPPTWPKDIGRNQWQWGVIEQWAILTGRLPGVSARLSCGHSRRVAPDTELPDVADCPRCDAEREITSISADDEG